MKVYIITEAGKGRGFGHITRCLSLCEAFQERNINAKIFLETTDDLSSVLSGKEYTCFSWEESTPIIEELSANDVVILDSYIAGESFYQRVSQKVGLSIFFDDNHRLSYPQGIIINGAIDATQLNYPQAEHLRYLLGSDYLPLRKEFWNVSPKEVKDATSNILVTVGGDDQFGLTLRILKLIDRNFPHVHKSAIVTEFCKDLEALKEMQDQKTDIVLQPSAKEIKELMGHSDIAISAGGQTLYELAATGTPTIALSVSRDQDLNISGLESRGFLQCAGFYSDHDLDDKLCTLINFLFDKDKRKEASHLGRSLVDGKGAQRIVDFVCEVMEKKVVI